MSFLKPQKIDIPEPVIPVNPIEEEARQKQLAAERVTKARGAGRTQLGKNLLEESRQGGLLSRPQLGGQTIIG